MSGSLREGLYIFTQQGSGITTSSPPPSLLVRHLYWFLARDSML